MQYWHDIITEKSWNILQKIKKKFNFVLIGGWATYLWTRSLKSKDIDIIVDFKTLNKLKLDYDLRKNDNLKKYEIKIEEIDIDIYVPFYSKLTFPINEIRKDVTKIEGFNIVNPEILLILKQGAEIERKHSEKGEKDRLDIISILLNINIDFKKYHKLLEKHKLNHYYKRLIEIITIFKNYDYFKLTPREYKLKKNKIINKIKN